MACSLQLFCCSRVTLYLADNPQASIARVCAEVADKLAAEELRGEVSLLQSWLVVLEGELDTEKRAHCLFEAMRMTPHHAAHTSPAARPPLRHSRPSA